MNTINVVLANKALLMAVAIVGLLGGIFLILNIHLLVMGRRYRRLMRGVQGGNLETLLQDSLQATQEAGQRIERLEATCRELRVTTANSLQHVGFLRFNAFADRGGESSFVLALLNDHSDGVVLCCLMNREECRLYGKPVVGGTSTYTLSQDEKVAIEKAMGGQRC